MTDLLVLFMFILAMVGSAMIVKMARNREDMTGRTIYVLSIILSIGNALGIIKWVMLAL